MIARKQQAFLWKQGEQRETMAAVKAKKSNTRNKLAPPFSQ